MKGSFITEDTYLGDITNPLTLNRYGYCIGNPLFYSDPSGHEPLGEFTFDYNLALDILKVDIKERDILNKRQDRINEAMDNIYNWLGGEDRSSAKQFLDGFVTGFVGSFYATYDAITNPEDLVALAYYVVTRPQKILAGMLAGNANQMRYYVETKNYRALGQEIGYSVGKMVQIAITRAAVKKCGELLNKTKSKINSLNGLPKNQGYSSFDKLRKAIGSPGANKDWHHIVEKSQIKRSGFTPEQIHNTSNIIAVDHATHLKISGYYSSKLTFTNGLTVREWLTGQDFYTQYNFGLGVLKEFGVIK